MDGDDVKAKTLTAGTVDHSSNQAKNTAIRRRYRRIRGSPADDASPDAARSRALPFIQQSLSKDAEEFHPTLRRVALFLSIYMGVSTLSFYIVMHQLEGVKTNRLLDAIYFCVVTMTTVGYGDLTPNTTPAKLLACAFVFPGMALVGLSMVKAADHLVEKQEGLLTRALHVHPYVGQTNTIEETEANKAKSKLVAIAWLLLLLIAIGTIFLSWVEGLSVVDSFYCVCSTVSALGYGDKSFSTVAGRLFAIFWITTSTICMAQFFLYVAEFSTERRQQELARLVLNRRMTFIDLQAADLDRDGAVGAAEFIIYKLKEMGRIKEEDIAMVLDEFEDLDVDRSGTLTAASLMLAQSDLAPDHTSRKTR